MSEDDVRVVVVDDFLDAAEALAETLMMSGYKVWVATDGTGALALVETHRPHCVLLDIGMPGMDGYEVARELRSRYPNRRTPLIALSGWGQQQDRDQAHRAGFDHHLVKPAELDALRSLLGTLGGKSAGA